LAWYGKTKPNTTKARIHNEKKCTTTQIRNKKLKPGSVAAHNIRPEMERVYSGFSAAYICHLLTYLDTYPLIAPPDPHGTEAEAGN